MIQAELIQRAQEGDRQALEELLTALAPRLERYGKRLCSAYAEDALQDTLVAITKELPRFRGDSDLSSWAYTLVRTACARLSRGKVNTHSTPLDTQVEQPSSEGSPEHSAEHSERRDVFNCAIQTLPMELKDAVLLRDIEELSAEEAAGILAVSVPALKSRLHRGRAALSKAIDEQLQKGPAARNCPDVLSALSQQYEGELSLQACDELSKHLKDCPGCEQRCARLKEAFIECRKMNAPTPSQHHKSPRLR